MKGCIAVVLFVLTVANVQIANASTVEEGLLAKSADLINTCNLARRTFKSDIQLDEKLELWRQLSNDLELVGNDLTKLDPEAEQANVIGQRVANVTKFLLDWKQTIEVNAKL